MRKYWLLCGLLLSQFVMAQGDVIPCKVLESESCVTEGLSSSTVNNLRDWVSGETTYFDAYTSRFDILFASAVINTILTGISFFVTLEKGDSFIQQKPWWGAIGSLLALAGTWRLAQVASLDSIEVLSGSAMLYSWLMSLAGSLSYNGNNAAQIANAVAFTALELVASSMVFWVYTNRAAVPCSRCKPIELRVDRKASRFMDQCDLALPGRLDICTFDGFGDVSGTICWIEQSPAKGN